MMDGRAVGRMVMIDIVCIDFCCLCLARYVVACSSLDF